MSEENVNTAEEVIEELEVLDSEEVDLIVSLLTKSTNRTIYKKEFTNSDDKLVSFLYIPLSVPNELRGKKIEFGVLSIKGYVATKCTMLGISLASPGTAEETFTIEDISKN